METIHPIERWQGIYASSDVAPLLIRNITDAITLVSVTSGIGMTLSFGLAESNINAVLPAMTTNSPAR